jgi:hypothetical protein
VRCCSFVNADGSVNPPVGWAHASRAMSDIFDGGSRESSTRLVVVELGAGSLRERAGSSRSHDACVCQALE